MNASLNLTTDKTMSSGENAPEPLSRAFPSGRSVVLRMDDGQEELEIRSPRGEVEVRITLTDSGPVVCVRGARLELAATDTVALQCRQFHVRTTEETRLSSVGEVHITGQELHVRTEQDIHLDGAVIRLNCAETAEERGQKTDL